MPDPVLLYEFTPDKVSVSVGGESPVESLVDLEVKINNRGPAVKVERITIEIPMGTHGHSAGNRLSASGRLPDPEYDGKLRDAWTIKVDEDNGSLLTIEAQNKQPTPLATTIELTFRGILVNDTPGIVPVTVDEFAPGHIKATFQIDKEDAERPVQRFYVADEHGNELNPAVLNEVDRRVLVKWSCTAQGEDYSYSLRTEQGEAWEPKDWRRNGHFFSCADGTSGIKTEKLAETTTFALEVIKNRSVQQVLRTTVSVDVPALSENSFVKKYLSGRLVSLNWRAINAGKCVVEMDGRIIDRNAPTDTYDDGYFIALAAGAGAHTPTVRAYAHTGRARTSKVFEPISVDPPVTIPTPLGISLLKVTPNGKYALAAGQFSNKLFRINLLTNELIAITVGRATSGIAITPDSRLAFVVNLFDHNVSVVDIENATASPDPIPTEKKASKIALTPDGNFALVAHQWPGQISVINVAEKRVASVIPFDGENPFDIRTAKTNEVDVAVVATAEGTVRFIDIRNWRVEPTVIRTASDNMPSLAMTPDGKVALVIIAEDSSVHVIDVPNRTKLSMILPAVRMMDVTPDGKLMLALHPDGALDVRNISHLGASPLTVELGMNPGCMAVSGAGNLFLVATDVVGMKDPGSVIKFTLLESD